MNTYLILGSIFSFLIGVCKVLSLGKLIRLWQYKRLYPTATLEQTKECEKLSKRNYYFFPINRDEI